MIELLSSYAKPAVTYPDSGPGPQTLAKGNEDFGYFGTLTAANFLTTEELSDMCEVTEGTVFTASPTWVKCMIKKKVLFIPIALLRTGLTYTALYNKGAVYADDTTGKYPIGSGVIQDRRIMARNALFKVRLFGQDDPDPATQTSGNIVMKNFEIGRFITGFFQTPNPSSPTADFADSFNVVSYSVYSQQLTAKYISVMPTVNGNVNNCPYMYMRAAGGFEVQSAAKTLATSYWWPVLELEDPNKVIAARNITSNPNNGLVPIAVSSFTYEA